jgi:hypothetical protein
MFETTNQKVTTQRGLVSHDNQNQQNTGKVLFIPQISNPPCSALEPCQGAYTSPS